MRGEIEEDPIRVSVKTGKEESYQSSSDILDFQACFVICCPSEIIEKNTNCLNQESVRGSIFKM